MNIIQRNDRRDYDKNELLLLRVGHHIVRESRRKGLTAYERELFWEAFELVCVAKRAYRAEQAAIRKAKGEKFAAKMRNKLVSVG